jgi:hypothetical protein
LWNADIVPPAAVEDARHTPTVTSMEEKAMRRNTVRLLEGRQVCVALRNGSRIDDCQLVSAGRISTDTLWLFSNGADLFVSIDEVLDVWEAPGTTRAA